MRQAIQDAVVATLMAAIYLVAGEYMPISVMLLAFGAGYLFVERYV